MARTYPAKILLFGEHTVLRGGQGLAVPYPRLSLCWSRGKPDVRLLAFADYLRQHVPAWALPAGAMESFLKAGNRLVGDIPTGYGLGSSGAVCAALWDRFATEKGRTLKGEDLRAMLATMEGYFHGNSSGTDPLICYLEQPMTIGGGNPSAPVTLPADWEKNFFLVDSGHERSAATYIERFTQRYDTDPAFAHDVDAEWRAPANACCDALVTSNRQELEQAFRAVSYFQFGSLPDFIPPGYYSKWLHDGYYLKICGAGGGGMLLGYALDQEAVEASFGEVAWLRKNPA
ncbi:MAG: hypothetical protein AAFZ52_01855 [Bacteroidota bacterium]